MLLLVPPRRLKLIEQYKMRIVAFAYSNTPLSSGGSSPLPKICIKPTASSYLGASFISRIHSKTHVSSLRKSKAKHISATLESSPSNQTGKSRKIVIDGAEVAYDYFPGSSSPCIFYLPGFFYSKNRYAKSNALELFSRRKEQSYLLMDYYGTGRSQGDFKDGTISKWLSDALTLLDKVIPDQKILIVGSGIGVWIGLHVALQRPSIVTGIVGISPDPDFTHDLLLPALTPKQKEVLETEGLLDLPWGSRTYPISKKLIDDAASKLLMQGGRDSINVICPVRIIQGLADEEVPPQRALKLTDRLKSDDVAVTFVKYGDHVLETEDDFKRMWETVCELSDKYFEYDLRSPQSG